MRTTHDAGVFCHLHARRSRSRQHRQHDVARVPGAVMDRHPPDHRLRHRRLAPRRVWRGPRHAARRVGRGRGRRACAEHTAATVRTDDGRPRARVLGIKASARRWRPRCAQSHIESRTGPRSPGNAKPSRKWPTARRAPGSTGPSSSPPVGKTRAVSRRPATAGRAYRLT